MQGSYYDTDLLGKKAVVGCLFTLRAWRTIEFLTDVVLGIIPEEKNLQDDRHVR